MNTLKSISSAVISGIITIPLMTAIIIVAELSAPFKNWLKGFTGHHWITKSWIVVIAFAAIFIIVRLMVRDPDQSRLRGKVFSFAVMSIACSVILLGFYVFESLRFSYSWS